MKILMLGKLGLFESSGGDRIQIERTAEELRLLGHVVDIKADLAFDPRGYSLVHIFQLDWTPETYLYAKKVKSFNIPIVLSPIHHNVSEVKKFDDSFAFDFRRVSRVLFKDQFARDTFKNVYRSIFSPKKLYPTLVSIVKGFKNIQQETLKMAAMVLVQTDAEKLDLEKTYGVKFRCFKVPNGVSSKFLVTEFGPNPLPFAEYILSVGRIEPRKNQLSLIQAVASLRQTYSLNFNLVLIGNKNLRQHFEYHRLFQQELKKYPWITYIPQVSYDDMPLYYHYAKVGVSVSWFETTGLTSLEAVFCGTNAVATGARAKECLGAYASYCEPYDISTIKTAIYKEYLAPRPLVDETLRKEYTWKNAALKTLASYAQVLGKN